MKTPPRFTTLGSDSVKREFTRAHIRRLRQWFDAAGNFRHAGTPPTSRERLWNCFSLLQGDPAAVRLANRIILKTPIDANHFEPITAAEVALRFPDKLTPAAYQHLVEMVRRHYVNLLEWRFGTCGMHNFVCMTTWFLLAAPYLLDRFTLDHEFASISAVYSGERMKEIARNALHLLQREWERRSISTEFNSPTYSPIAVMAIAKIVELIPDPAVRAMALEIEVRHWRELLSLSHPCLSLPVGPYSRAYRVDVLGQISCMRMLMSYLGLSCDRSLADLFDETESDLTFHHDGDVPFNWSQAAWLISTRYHLPVVALREFRHRRYPYRFRSEVSWDAFGVIDRKHKRLLSVHGDALPGGMTDVVQVQHKDWALGWRSYTAFGHTFPIHLHYALHTPVRTMRDVRSVISGVMFQSKPEEWTKNHRGQPIESGNFNHFGHVRVNEDRGGLAFTGRPLESLAPLPTEEISINTLIPTHFNPITDIRLNGRQFSDATIKLVVKTAMLDVRDQGFRYRIEYRFAEPTLVRLDRWAKFLRFAGFFYEGPPHEVRAAQLAKWVVRGKFQAV